MVPFGSNDLQSYHEQSIDKDDISVRDKDAVKMKRSSSIASLSGRSSGGLRNLAKTMLPRSRVNSQIQKPQNREREGELSFNERVEVLAEHFNEWYSSLDTDTRKVLTWQESRYERDIEFREGIIYDITECFSAVDFDEDGVINNIQFFVMWRELEEKWRR